MRLMTYPIFLCIYLNLELKIKFGGNIPDLLIYPVNNLYKQCERERGCV